MNDDLIKEDKKKKKKKSHAYTKPFFNSNVFGDDYEVDEEEIEEIALPPPVFSEEELNAEKEKAFNKGKAEGVRETVESRDQLVAGLLSDLTQATRTLIGAENEREKRFEGEAVRLCLQIFEQLFPHYHTQQGFEEMQQALLSIIQSEEGTSQILIEVHPDYVSDIQGFIKSRAAELPRDCCYEVSGAASFNTSQFKLSWKDGGAVYDIDSLALRIRDTLHDVLAGTAENPHDKDQDLPQSSATETIMPNNDAPDTNGVPNDEETGDVE